MKYIVPAIFAFLLTVHCYSQNADTSKRVSFKIRNPDTTSCDTAEIAKLLIGKWTDTSNMSYTLTFTGKILSGPLLFGKQYLENDISKSAGVWVITSKAVCRGGYSTFEMQFVHDDAFDAPYECRLQNNNSTLIVNYGRKIIFYRKQNVR